MRYWLLGLVCLFANHLIGQSSEKAQIIEQSIEFLMQDGNAEEADLTTLFDNLYYILEHPININTCEAQELLQLGIINENQAFAILRFREQYGTFYSYYELGSIEELSPELIKLLVPFITFKKEIKQEKQLANALRYGKHQVLFRHSLRPETTNAYTLEEGFAGSRDKVYARYRFRYRNRLSFGITTEKDPGEKFWSDSINQPDFLSAHFQYASKKFLRQVVIGDYQLQVGQGLTFWSGFGTRKSAFMATSIKRFGRGLVPYTSTEENNFLRGTAVKIGSDKLQLAVFGSAKKVDANRQVLQDSLGEELAFSSIQTSGLHRTTNEIENHDALHEQVGGARVNFGYKNVKLGLTGILTRYDGDFSARPQLYQSFQGINSNSANAGFDYDIAFGKFNFFGELSLDNDQTVAYINGLNAYLDSRFTLTIFNRYYPYNYQNQFSNAFGEKGTNYNEQGTYVGFQLLASKGIKLNGYYDLYRFNWIGYQHDFPVNGNELGLGAEVKLSQSASLNLMYRNENTIKNALESTLNKSQLQSLSQYRAELKYSFNEKWSGKNRIAYRVFNDETEKTGSLIFQDIIYKPSDKLRFIGRYALFDTDDYSTRIYTYENDLTYQFSVPSFYLSGSRVYFIFNYKPSKLAQIQIKWSQTYWNEARTIGSGLDSYIGHTRNEVKTQIILKF